MKETAKDYLFRSLKWLGGVFAVTVGILVGADQLVELGWPVEWYVIAFLSVGIFMLATLLIYFYRQMRKFEKKGEETSDRFPRRAGSKRSLENIITRGFSLYDRDNLFKVGTFSLEKNEQIEVRLQFNGRICLKIINPEGELWRLEPNISSPYLRIFKIPESGDYRFGLESEDPYSNGGIEIHRVRYSETPALPDVEPF